MNKNLVKEVGYETGRKHPVRVLLVLLTVVSLVVFLALSSCSSTRTSRTVESTGSSGSQQQNPADSPAAMGGEQSAAANQPSGEEEEEPLIEIGSDQDIAIGLSDPKANPTLTLKPGEGFWVSSDPGTFTVGSAQAVSSGEYGYMAYVLNSSNENVTVVLTTGWNEPNQRWNVHPVQYEVKDFSALRNLVLQVNEGEKKPTVFGYTFENGALTPDPAL